MMHYGGRDYNVAASEAAARGRVKMEEIIQKGLQGAQAVIEQVQNQIVSDHVVKGSALKFRLQEAQGLAEDVPADEQVLIPEIVMDLPSGDVRKIHDHALGQMADRAELGTRFISTFSRKGQWGQDLIAENLQRIYSQGNGTKYLVRSIGDEARGFLSDKFRRLDSRPLLESFVGACQEIGALPIEGYALDTKVRMRAVLPMVFEPVPNEIMLFGIEWGNSDFGAGGHYVGLWNMRVWCTNTATVDEVLRQVHLGARLQENIEYSRRTYELDTQANASALKDVVIHALNPARVDMYCAAIKEACETEVAPKDALAILKKKLTKEETEQAVAAFNSPDVENLPAGNNTYRLSNAISWIANAAKPERKLELNKIAGDVLPKSNTIKPVTV